MEEILQGYVIRFVPYLENDAIVTIVSKTKGIVSFKARGVQKSTSKNNPSCQLFVKGEYLLDYKQEDGHRRLRSGIVENGYSPMYYDIKRLIVLTLASEGLLKFEASDFDDAYIFLDKLFQIIQGEYFHYPTAILVLLSIFMTRSGCQLTADHCVNCGKTTDICIVSYDDGGYLCSRCHAGHNTMVQTTEYLKYFRIVMKAQITNVSQFQVPVEVGYLLIRDFLNHLEKQVGIRFKSQSMILQQLME